MPAFSRKGAEALRGKWMKKVAIIVVFILLGTVANAQTLEERIKNWKMFEDSTYVEGSGILDYLLFRVGEYETNTMKGAAFYLAYIELLENEGYIVDYGSIRDSLDNTALSVNVKRLMERYNANISVTYRPNSNGSTTVIINHLFIRELEGGRSTYDTVWFNIYKR